RSRTMRPTLALLTVLLCCPPARPQVPEKPVGFRDDFAADSRKEYEAKGEVRWQKGSVLLGPGAELRRRLALGYTAELRATVRLQPGEISHVMFCLADGGRRAAGGLALGRGRAVLGNATALPPQVVDLGPAEAGLWDVRLRLRYGLVEVKAWKHGAD